MKIIVNADDFGYSDEVNLAIIGSVESGLVSSTTIMANAPACENACAFARDCRADVSFGVHLNLTEFDFLTKSDILRELRLSDTVMRRKFFSDFRADILRAVKREWCEQIGRVLDCGVHISHIDGHNNIHSSPNLAFVLPDVLRKFGIKKIRGIKNIRAGRFSSAKKLYVLSWRFLMRNVFSFSITDYLTNYSEFVKLSPYLKNDSIVELMCHPGGTFLPEECIMLENHSLDAIGVKYKLINYNNI